MTTNTEPTQANTPQPAKVAQPALTQEEANAAVARGTAAGKELAEQLIRGDAPPGRLFEAVQQRYTTPSGFVEIAGLLHVVANVVSVLPSTMKAVAQEAAESTTQRVGAAAAAVLSAAHEQQAQYLEGVDKALRDIHAAYVHESKHAAAPFFVPSLPPKPKRITFERGPNGDIAGAVLRT